VEGIPTKHKPDAANPSVLLLPPSSSSSSSFLFFRLIEADQRKSDYLVRRCQMPVTGKRQIQQCKNAKRQTLIKKTPFFFP
jgi:hypothetical protein